MYTHTHTHKIEAVWGTYNKGTWFNAVNTEFGDGWSSEVWPSELRSECRVEMN